MLTSTETKKKSGPERFDNLLDLAEAQIGQLDAGPRGLLHREEERERASLVAQWLRIHLPTQGTRV